VSFANVSGDGPLVNFAFTAGILPIADPTELGPFEGPGILPGPPERREEYLFPLLEYCELSGSSSTLRQVLSSVSSRSLAEMSLLVKEASLDDLKAPNLLPCLNILERKINLQRSLTTFKLSMAALETSDLPLCPASFVKPLRHMKHLKRLQVMSPVETLANFVHEVVLNLGELENLQVPMHATHTINISSLHSLATSCPNLRMLVIPIRTLPGTIPELPVHIPTSHHGLRELRTSETGGWNSMQGHILAARHVNALFPNLENLEGGRGWSAVWTIVKMIRDVTRRQADV
jgi:hypothetical protein